jgi:hypothetical protein
MIRSVCLAFVLVSVSVSGCAAQQQSAQEPREAEATPSAEPEAVHQAGPVGSKLTRDLIEAEQAYEIGKDDGRGLAGYNVKTSGKAVWPPAGEGCDGLVRCCNALAELSETLALACVMAAARDSACSVALATSVAIATEQSYAVPPACKP